MNLRELVEKAYFASIESGWYDDPGDFNIGEKLALIHSEVSEALEVARVSLSNIAQAMYDNDGKPIGFDSEMADIVIRVADLCGHLHIDLERAVGEKMAFNKIRGHKHGGKAF